MLRFVSPTNLHCSQTKCLLLHLRRQFVSPTNLHCSQTGVCICIQDDLFVSPTNLHCSQTRSLYLHILKSLFPLRIYTALKPIDWLSFTVLVCFPYEFTLLSNNVPVSKLFTQVCFPYEFTLLSNSTIIKHTQI